MDRGACRARARVRTARADDARSRRADDARLPRERRRAVCCRDVSAPFKITNDERESRNGESRPPAAPLRRSEVVVRRCGYATGASADASLEAIRLADEKTLLTMLESTIDTHNKATRKALN